MREASQILSRFAIFDEFLSRARQGPFLYPERAGIAGGTAGWIVVGRACPL
jgi:hypothetical protein